MSVARPTRSAAKKIQENMLEDGSLQAMFGSLLVRGYALVQGAIYSREAMVLETGAWSRGGYFAYYHAGGSSLVGRAAPSSSVFHCKRARARRHVGRLRGKRARWISTWASMSSEIVINRTTVSVARRSWNSSPAGGGGGSGGLRALQNRIFSPIALCISLSCCDADAPAMQFQDGVSSTLQTMRSSLAAQRFDPRKLRLVELLRRDAPAMQFQDGVGASEVGYFRRFPE